MSSQAPVSSQAPSNPMAGFGPNEWLVDEIYQQYLADKDSVDPAWWDFFADYQPADATLPKPPAPTENGHRRARGSGSRGAGSPAPTATPTASAPEAEAPAAPAQPAAAPQRQQSPAAPATQPSPGRDEVEEVPLRGAAARVVDNMEASLTVPTATSRPGGARPSCSSTTGP